MGNLHLLLMELGDEVGQPAPGFTRLGLWWFEARLRASNFIYAAGRCVRHRLGYKSSRPR